MLSERYWTFQWESHLKYLLFFFSICYYYCHHYFIPSRRWFLTYISPNFENPFFGLILSVSLNPFVPQIYVYTSFFFFFFHFSFYINFSFMIFIIIIIINVYVFSTCTGLFEKRIRFPQGLSLVFTRILELFIFVLLNCESLWIWSIKKNKISSEFN